MKIGILSDAHGNEIGLNICLKYFSKMDVKKISLYFIFFLLLNFLVVDISFGQYWGEKVLEKSFERSDFFFQPVYVNPFGLGTFNKVTPGLINNPLLNLSVNPALFSTDSSRNTFLYIDFRNSKTISF